MRAPVECRGMDEEEVIRMPVHCDRYETFEELALGLSGYIADASRAGRRVVSVSHAVDPGSPDGKPYSLILVTRDG